ncbi:MAG: riboflavin biosynthesis protein RibF, partial [bacterium]
VLTFEPHPVKVLNPAMAPPLLTCAEHKARLLATLGMNGCLTLKFTRALASKTPAAFVDELCQNVPTLHTMVVGNDWQFGRNGTGNIECLRTLMQMRHIPVLGVDPVMWHGAAISSTRIRNSVAHGRLDNALSMLGRPFSILGKVIHGCKIGRTLGFPTANINPCNDVRPVHGVYAVQADIGENIVVDGVMSIGIRPTFATTTAATTYELHIPKFTGSLYGRTVEVFFIRKLRNERRFRSPTALAAQIARDVRMASIVLSKDTDKII